MRIATLFSVHRPPRVLALSWTLPEVTGWRNLQESGKKSSASSSTRSTQPGLQSVMRRRESPGVKQKMEKVCLDHLEDTSKSKVT